MKELIELIASLPWGTWYLFVRIVIELLKTAIEFNKTITELIKQLNTKKKKATKSTLTKK